MKHTPRASQQHKAKAGRKGIPSKQLKADLDRTKFRSAFSARFQERRAAIGMTQSQLAGALGISQGRIAKYETGRALPRLDELSESCRQLECDPNYLLGFPTALTRKTFPSPTGNSAALDASDVLITTIVATGGLVPLANGLFAPAADHDWIELAEAYLHACDEKGLEPLIRSDSELSSL